MYREGKWQNIHPSLDSICFSGGGIWKTYTFYNIYVRKVGILYNVHVLFF